MKGRSMRKQEFVEMACVMGLVAHRNESERRQHVQDLKATALAMWAELLEDENEPLSEAPAGGPGSKGKAAK